MSDGAAEGGAGPALRLFVADAEAAWAGTRGRSALHQQLDRDLGLLPGLLTEAAGDIVLVDRPRPGLAEVVTALRERGVPCADVVGCDRDGGRLHDDSRRAGGDGPLAAVARLAPWAWTPAVAALLQPLRRRLGVSDATVGAWIAASRQLGDKARALDLRAAVGDPGGWLCDDLDALRRHWRQAEALGQALLCKARYGASGRDALRLLPGRGEPTAAQATWLQRAIARQGAVVVERLWPRTGDLGRLYVADGARAAAGGASPWAALPPHRSLCDARGFFRGVCLGSGPSRGPLAPGGPSAAAGRWAALDAAVAALAHRYGIDAAAGIGIGVDCIVRAAVVPDGSAVPDADPSAAHDLAGLPWPVELNARWTLGHIAYALGRRLAPGAAGRLWLLGPADARAAGCDLAALAGRLAGRLPTAVDADGIACDALPLAVSAEARVLPMLLVGADDAAVEAALAAAGAPSPSARLASFVPG